MSRFDSDKFHKDFDRDFKKMTMLGVAWFIVCAVVSLVVLGFGIWALVALVTWLTSK